MRNRLAGRSTALPWVGAAALVAISASATAFAVVLVFRADSAGTDESPTPTVQRTLVLRAAPDTGASEGVELRAGVPVVLLGRTADSSWLMLEIPDRPDVAGWAPAGDIQDAGDIAALPPTWDEPVATPAATANPTAAATAPGTPAADLPDLVIEAVSSRENRLVVVVRNVGAADSGGPLFVIVDGGPRQRIDVEGKPLRPGDTLEAVLEQEYVQRRASVTVEIALAEGVAEADADNNLFDVVVTPDRDNDLEVRSVALDPDDGHLIVTVRNNSMIPLVGTVTISVRRTQPESLLLKRLVEDLDVDAGAEQRYHFDDLTDLDLTRTRVILSSDAINDADGTNNVFPR